MMDTRTSDAVEKEIKEIVSQFCDVPSADIGLSAWVTTYGLDSLSTLVFRETLERVFGVFFSDERWLGFGALNELVAAITTRDDAPLTPAQPADSKTDPVRRLPGGSRLASTGTFYEDLEIGMPLTGLNNLSEGPLLQRLGDIRWRHVSTLCGVPSRLVVDEEGQRLYPTFFYVEVAFPSNRPMAAYGENDRITVASTVQRFGGSMLDGISFLLPLGADERRSLPIDIPDAKAQGIPAVRMSNIFVKQFGGAEWLKKSRPANSGFARIPETMTPPDSYAFTKEAGNTQSFSHPLLTEHYLPMTDGFVRAEYRLLADRDLNGAGLVYFANYSVFLDICERLVLGNASLALSDHMLDKRTVIHRRSAYLNNASSRDTLLVDVEAWIQKPRPDDPAPEAAPIRLLLNYRMFRKSDERLMMVCTAEKLIVGHTLEDVAFFDAIRTT